MARKKSVEIPRESLPSDDPSWKPSTWDEVIAGFDPENRPLLQKWRDRGDGVAVYRNEALDSLNHGRCQALSFGSESSNWPDSRGPLPKSWPFACPVNWAYLLLAAVR